LEKPKKKFKEKRTRRGEERSISRGACAGYRRGAPGKRLRVLEKRRGGRIQEKTRKNPNRDIKIAVDRTSKKNPVVSYRGMFRLV